MKLLSLVVEIKEAPSAGVERRATPEANTSQRKG